MDEGRGLGATRIACRQGVEDVLMLGHRPRPGPFLGDPAPGPGADRPAGDRVQHRREGLVAGGGPHEAMEVRVVLDPLGLGGCLAHALEAATELRQGFVVDALGGEGGRRGLEDPADPDQLELEPFLHQFDGRPDPFEEELRPKAGDIGPVAASDVQHPGRDKRPDRLADRVAGRPEQGREVSLGRETRPWHQFARRDHLAHLGDRGLGERGSHGVTSWCGVDRRWSRRYRETVAKEYH